MEEINLGIWFAHGVTHCGKSGSDSSFSTQVHLGFIHVTDKRQSWGNPIWYSLIPLLRE